MKRTKRITALLLAVLLCLSLTGCGALEKMRLAQGYWQKDGTVLWQGEVYKPIQTGNLSLNIEADEETEYAFITQADVPVMLSAILGDEFYVYNDGMFLERDWYISDETYTLYCRADSYDMVVARIAEGFTLDKICYDYSVYDEDGWYDHDDTYTLTEEQRRAVMDVYTSVMPTVMVDGMYLAGDFTVSLWGYTEDGLFMEYLFDMHLSGNHYYLSDDNKNVYMIPAEYTAIAAAIMAPMIEQEKIWYDEPEEDFNEDYYIL